MSRLSIPAKGRLPPDLRIDPFNLTVQKTLNRLSRASLLSLALDWLDERSLALSQPFLRPRDPNDADDDEDGVDGVDDFYPPARSVAGLRERYVEMQALKGSKREIIDRIVEGDWRHGLSLYQLAMADLQYLHDHQTSQHWTAYRMLPLQSPAETEVVDAPLKADKESLVIPRFHPSTFLRNLQSEVLPDVKAHYHMDQHKELPIALVRIFILDSPYTTRMAFSGDLGAGSAASFDASRTLFIAFPHDSPFIYISRTQSVGLTESGESRSLRGLVVEGIPKALSRPRERYTLESTSLSTRNLSALLHSRGPQRTNFAGGGWSIYADETTTESPLETVLPTPPLSDASEGLEGPEGPEGSKPISARPHKRKTVASDDLEERLARKAKLVAQGRFGESARIDDANGVERLDVVVKDPFPKPNGGRGQASGDNDPGTQRAHRRQKNGRREHMDSGPEHGAGALDADGTDDQKGTWIPNLALTFRGSHVFAGIRQLVEAGIMDGEKLPGWLTGEDGVTVGDVRNGRIKGGNKGSGL